jgi:hypothetical protein
MPPIQVLQLVDVCHAEALLEALRQLGCLVPAAPHENGRR